MGPVGISATDDWTAYAAERRHPHVDYRPLLSGMIPWFVCRDASGRWCVQRHGAWSCVVTLTGVSTGDDARLEEHARAVADALNRIYMTPLLPRGR